MRTLAFWVILFAIVVCLRGVAYLELDPSDAYRFVYIGAKWTQGLVPYDDVIANKPPAIFAVNALAYLINPVHQELVLYVIEVFLALVTALCLADMIRHWLGRPFDHLVTPIAVILAYGLWLNYTGNLCETYQVAGTVTGLWVVTRFGVGRSPWWYLVGGGLIGLGAMFKPPGFAAGMAVVIWLVFEWVAGRLDPRRAAARIVLVVAGLSGPWLIAVFYFALDGLAGAMLYQSLSYNRAYGQEMWRSYGPVWVVLKSYRELWAALPLLALASWTILSLLWPSRLLARGETRANWRLLAVLWMLGDLAGALAGGRSYEHYFIPLMISASAVASFALADAIRPLSGLPEGTSARRVGLVVLWIWLGLMVGRDLVWGASLLEAGGRSPDGVAREEIAQKIRRLARPGDTLFTWGSAAYFFAATGLDPIFPDMDTHRAYDFDAKAEQIGRDLSIALEANPPRFLVTDVNEDHPQRDVPELRQAFEQFKTLIASRYRPVLRRGPRTLYVRHEPTTTGEATTGPTTTSTRGVSTSPAPTTKATTHPTTSAASRPR